MWDVIGLQTTDNNLPFPTTLPGLQENSKNNSLTSLFDSQVSYWLGTWASSHLGQAWCHCTGIKLLCCCCFFQQKYKSTQTKAASLDVKQCFMLTNESITVFYHLQLSPIYSLFVVQYNRTITICSTLQVREQRLVLLWLRRGSVFQFHTRLNSLVRHGFCTLTWKNIKA